MARPSRRVQLPRPDDRGTFWFDRPAGPVIFRSGTPARPVRPGKFFACHPGGILCRGNGICYFDSPEEALEALLRVGAFGGG